ncbi:GNAT family N-acetyltransferase [Ruminococcus flavefaciens]|uniref:Ribosomal protein S18 acetylase RimI n=1 Tax=Ruminococcus flavefaciens TaxID=1265 RepID=A0A1K1LQX3_RUMFL|nr:GNAT family N-acetyltransferase [Ruminococcus flavefaciens]SFW13317.1 Ribosomal protein S18 acetylase RimI [Ruminococcus flavefaciens]
MIKVYKMQLDGNIDITCNISCIPFDMMYYKEYQRIYNDCFRKMRTALDIKPYDFLSDISQIADKCSDISLLIKDGKLIGSVACYGNEIDDLIVAPEYQHKGFGRQLLLWAIHSIRNKNSKPITLHVAEYNHNAAKLYKSVGFSVIETEIIS